LLILPKLASESFEDGSPLLRTMSTLGVPRQLKGTLEIPLARNGCFPYFFPGIRIANRKIATTSDQFPVN
jgi:hypothetical protein